MGGYNQIVKHGTAGHRALRVATYAVCDHQEAAIVRGRHDDGGDHVASQDIGADGDRVLVVWAHEAAMGEGSYAPAVRVDGLAGTIRL